MWNFLLVTYKRDVCFDQQCTVSSYQLSAPYSNFFHLHKAIQVAILSATKRKSDTWIFIQAHEKYPLNFKNGSASWSSHTLGLTSTLLSDWNFPILNSREKVVSEFPVARYNRVMLSRISAGIACLNSRKAISPKIKLWKVLPHS